MAGQFEDHGALWLHNNGEDFQGSIYGIRVHVERNGEKRSEKSPDYRIFVHKDDGPKEIGCLWERLSTRTGDSYLRGQINGRQVALWPAKQTKESSPRYRVMPPRDEQPKEAVAAAQEDSDVPF